MKSNPSSIPTIVLFGRTGSGKSALANRLLKTKVFAEGGTLHSATLKSQAQIGPWPTNENLQVCVVDTPGFADTRKDVTMETLLTNILTFLTNLKGGFNIALYLLPITKQRFDRHDQDELHLIGNLLGHEVFTHTFIVLTYADELDVKHRSKVVESYIKDLPTIIEEECFLDFDESKVLVSDFSNFGRFLERLEGLVHKTKKYQPKLAKELNPRDPESIKQFLFSSEIKEVLLSYESQIKDQVNQLSKMKSLYTNQLSVSDSINKKLEEQQRKRAKLEQELENIQWMTSQREANLSREISRLKNDNQTSERLKDELSNLKSSLSRTIDEKDKKIQSLILQISGLEDKLESQKSNSFGSTGHFVVSGGFPGVRVVHPFYGGFY